MRVSKRFLRPAGRLVQTKTVTVSMFSSFAKHFSMEHVPSAMHVHLVRMNYQGASGLQL